MKGFGYMAQHYSIADQELYEKIKPFIEFSYKYMVVFRSKHKNEFIVWNTLKPFSENGKKGHGHIPSLKMAKTICYNVADNKFPKSRDHYILISHIRCSNDEEYISKIEQLLDVRRQKGKTMSYKNTTKAVLQS
jgi:hypothetical protein